LGGTAPAFSELVKPPLDSPEKALLCARELQALRLRATQGGLTAALQISLETVKDIAKRIRRKLGVGRRRGDAYTGAEVKPSGGGLPKNPHPRHCGAEDD
jgi:ATP/maltotriose-dependent transcriptional regulator MalT